MRRGGWATCSPWRLPAGGTRSHRAGRPVHALHYTGQSGEERARLCIFSQQCYDRYGPSWPQGEKQIGEQQPWFALKAIQELADIVAGLNHAVPPLVNVLQVQTGHTCCPTRLALIAGYCTGRVAA
ncbi:uncharacterized protein L3040_007224 [Drepanopeziza brunnea f. sp. 'multigermtubi']|uniref:uncharacterized protein n=1 Tax=Drepanopeziza brunnea f. sp. 'multigermtubi' TaxID=698441 RepID=UPI002393C678|nr:hypothetical protein L3040_007224 [Drepanopeziza brunnea f. sp. 'multigermtubi']